MSTNRPSVVVLNSASLDGRLAVSPDILLLHGDERWQAIESWSAAWLIVRAGGTVPSRGTNCWR